MSSENVCMESNRIQSTQKSNLSISYKMRSQNDIFCHSKIQTKHFVIKTGPLGKRAVIGEYWYQLLIEHPYKNEQL